jgi:hypothetical protein
MMRLATSPSDLLPDPDPDPDPEGRAAWEPAETYADAGWEGGPGEVRREDGGVGGGS